MRRLRSAWIWGLVLGVCALIVVVRGTGRDPDAATQQLATRPGGETGISYLEGKQIATLAYPRITESSGLACSRDQPGVFYTHNDSGDSAVFYAFGTHGQHLGVFRVPGARNIDWEDMVSFRLDGENRLIFADTGDNDQRRSSYALYVVAEPEQVVEKRQMRGRTAKLIETIRFRYEDGPHNCEALGVDTTTRTILLVTKDPTRSVYELPLNLDGSDQTLTARKIATLALGWVTGMDLSPDGRRAVVLTYGDALEYVRESGKSWAQAFGGAPHPIRLPPRRQGESICYGPDGRTLYLTSEKRPTPLIEVPAARSRQVTTAPDGP